MSLMVAYTRLVTEFAHQFHQNVLERGNVLVDGLANTLRPTRNALIYAGATAAAFVAVGAIIKTIRRRKKVALQPAIRAPDNEDAIACDPTFINWRAVDESGDRDSVSDIVWERVQGSSR